MMENDEQKLESIKALFDILLADAEAKVAIETVATGVTGVADGVFSIVFLGVVGALMSAGSGFS